MRTIQTDAEDQDQDGAPKERNLESFRDDASTAKGVSSN